MTVWEGMETDALLVIKGNCERGIVKAAEKYAAGERGEFAEVASVISRAALEQINAELARRESV